MIDLHSHVLPGIDDGAPDLETAVAMCRLAAADGTHVLVATPHQQATGGRVTNELIRRLVGELQQAVDAAGIVLRIVPGADVRLSSAIGSAVALGQVMTIDGAGRYLLVEPPDFVVPRVFAMTLATVRGHGVTPIITHPERYLNIQLAPNLLLPLAQAGHVVQVTAGSLTGEFGDPVRRCAVTLVRRRLAHVVASDAHSATVRAPGLSLARRVVEKLLPPEEVVAMFDTRPARILAGEPVELPEPQLQRRRWWHGLGTVLFGGTRGL